MSTSTSTRPLPSTRRARSRPGDRASGPGPGPGRRHGERGRRPAWSARGAERAAGLLLAIAIGGIAWTRSGDWIALVGFVVLWAGWSCLYVAGESPVIPMAFSFQWIQVTCGLYYYAFTGRELRTMIESNYRPMVLMGLGCLTALMLGLVLGRTLVPARWKAGGQATTGGLSWRLLLTTYVVTLVLNGVLREVAWYVPGFTQGILAASFLHLGVVFLMFRRLVWPRFRWRWFGGILAIEVMMGFSGFFAGFREPLVLALLALIEVFDRRSSVHWARLGALVLAMLLAGVLWIGIRSTYRQEFNMGDFAASRASRIERIGSLSRDWFMSDGDEMMQNLDQLIDRLWAIYYPALAVDRVPSFLPHEDGTILAGAVRHLVMPRVFFPGKPALPSDSEMVRKYSGMFVASTEQNTSIAFGYAAESYVDFGVPLMFVPSFVHGVLVGVLYYFLWQLIRHRELAIGLVTVVFWLTLYLFERSWVKTLGLTGTLAIYLGGLVFVLDRWLPRAFFRAYPHAPEAEAKAKGSGAVEPVRARRTETG